MRRPEAEENLHARLSDTLKKYNHGEEEFVYIRNHHEPIIDRELWEAAQRETARRDLDGKRSTGHGNRYVFSGKLKCGECEAAFVSRQRTRKDGGSYKTWRCGRVAEFRRRHIDNAGNEVGCDAGRQISDIFAMDIMKQSVSALLTNVEFYAGQVSGIFRHYISSAQGMKISREEVEQKIQTLQEQKKNVLNAFFNHSITKEDMRLMNEQYDGQLAELSDCLTAVMRQQEKTTSLETLHCELKAAFRRLAEAPEKDVCFLGGLLHHMTVYPTDRVEIFLNLLPAKWVVPTVCGLVLQHDCDVPLLWIKYPTLKP